MFFTVCRSRALLLYSLLDRGKHLQPRMSHRDSLVGVDLLKPDRPWYVDLWGKAGQGQGLLSLLFQDGADSRAFTAEFGQAP